MSQEEQLRDLAKKIGESDIKIALSVQTLERLDKTSQQLSLIASDLSKLIAVHEKRLDILEESYKISDDAREKRRIEVDTKIETFSHVVKESEETLNHLIDKNKIISDGNIEKVRADFKNELDKIRSEFRTEFEKNEKKVSGLQKFAWGAIGMGTILGIIISQAGNIARLLIGT